MADFVLKVGDLEPPVSIQLMDTSGTPVDVTTATSVKFRIASVDTRVELFSRDVVVDAPTLGEFSYIWQAGDTDVAGTFYGEFVVEWPSDRPQTFPTSGYITISIEPKL